MNMRDSLNKYYYDTIVCDLRHLSRTGGGEISCNSMMYLDVISYQQEDGGCTVSRIAKTLNISNSAVTIKVNELVKLGLVQKSRSSQDKRVVQLSLTPETAEFLKAYDSPFERALQEVEKKFNAQEINTFCLILETFLEEYKKEF